VTNIAQVEHELVTAQHNTTLALVTVEYTTAVYILVVECSVTHSSEYHNSLQTFVAANSGVVNSSF